MVVWGVCRRTLEAASPSRLCLATAMRPYSARYSQRLSAISLYIGLIFYRQFFTSNSLSAILYRQFSTSNFLPLTKTLCAPVARVKGYVWHWYNTISRMIVGVAVLRPQTCLCEATHATSRLTCIIWCLYTVLRVSKLCQQIVTYLLICGMSYS